MKLNWKLPEAGELLELLKQYKYVLIVIAAGILLLAWPSGKRSEEPSAAAGVTGQEEDFSVEALEERLGEILSKVEGAGQVSVVLTVRSGMERVLATDRSMTQTADAQEQEEQTVVISTGSGEETVLITQKYPTFQGALVVCRGGDDPQVQLVLTRAVSALTGLGADRITVCKGS